VHPEAIGCIDGEQGNASSSVDSSECAEPESCGLSSEGLILPKQISKLQQVGEVKTRSIKSENMIFEAIIT
jgi:hypothetical protein